MDEAWRALDALTQRAVPAGARILRLTDPARAHEALDAQAKDPVDAIVAAWPTRALPLLPLLDAASRALRPGGALVILDLVWRTAPTLELLRAFAPRAGAEKVRPIEGYEMQADHAGFTVAERSFLEPATLGAALDDAQRAALAADARHAAGFTAWVMRSA